MPRLNHVIPNQRNENSRNVDFRRRRSPEVNRRDNLRYADHVIPNQRNNPNRVHVIDSRPRTCSHHRRYTHVQTDTRNYNLSLREMAYLPFIGTLIGIYHVAYGLFFVMHFDSHRTLKGLSWCGRGLVEMIPFVGGFSLYIYDQLKP